MQFKKSIPYNVVITGGEPCLSTDRLAHIVSAIKDNILSIIDITSTDGRKTKAYKIGLNTNGDFPIPSKIYKQLTYIDITYNGTLINPNGFPNPRLQTCYRKELFINDDTIIELIDSARQIGYSDLLFRETINYIDNPSVFDLMFRLQDKLNLKLIDTQFNVYDTWLFFDYKGFHVYFKKQNLELQRIWEIVNKDNICSLVVWSDGKITKSWDYHNELNMTELIGVK